jgi:hypothetical protein
MRPQTVTGRDGIAAKRAAAIREILACGNGFDIRAQQLGKISLSTDYLSVSRVQAFRQKVGEKNETRRDGAPSTPTAPFVLPYAGKTHHV